MEKLLEPGKYVVAVSGGVDSVVLLDMLSRDKNLELIVAHFDHGIREDSSSDTEFVRSLSGKYGYEFATRREELGAGASEETARKRRYLFLKETMSIHGAAGIVTAHHQDDLIETAILNTLRGTKRRGLVSLKSSGIYKRPLLNMTKKEIIEYAGAKALEWREDETNSQIHYRRNRIRHLIKNSLTERKRREIIELLSTIARQDKDIDAEVNEYLKTQAPGALDKKSLNRMDLAEAYEIAAGWLRANGASFDKPAIERLVINARTLDNGSQIDIGGNYYCELSKTSITLKHR